MVHKTNVSKLLGAILLIAGTTIGAGILALPVSTGRAGFIPSILTMLFSWLYLTYTAFCILEVNLAVEAKGNIISMASQTLGKTGKYISWVAYLFLLYALNTAYIAVSTSIFQNILEKITGHAIAHILCIAPLLIAFALLLRRGMKIVDEINRILMIGLVIAFIILLAFSLPHVQLDYLKPVNLSFMISSLSTIMTAFGFHIIIPSLVTYLHGNVKDLRRAIWIGSAIPLIAYLLWQVAILGMVPIAGNWSLETAYLQGLNGADLLAELTHHPLASWVAQAFALFVILTSFLGVSVSLFDFLADGLKIENRAQGKWKLFFFTFVPPLYFSLAYPRAFFSALEYAGAFGVVVLLALIPALMVWRKRYVLHMPSDYQVVGGKVGLVLIIGISCMLIVCELLLKMNIVG
ncbi:MAG: Tyrosine transporter [Chlamydiia bacterium]|nr:Tyrosine transporter [Chlamydiia bacterium]